MATRRKRKPRPSEIAKYTEKGKRTGLTVRRAKPGRAGRPKIEFDLKAVQGLGQMRASQREMAAIFGCSPSVIAEQMADTEPWSDFRAAYEKGFAGRCTSLRRAQTQLAMGELESVVSAVDEKGRAVLHPETGEPLKVAAKVKQRPDTSMLIWLGKQDLAQRDIVETANLNRNEGGGPGGATIVFLDPGEVKNDEEWKAHVDRWQQERMAAAQARVAGDPAGQSGTSVPAASPKNGHGKNGNGHRASKS